MAAHETGPRRQPADRGSELPAHDRGGLKSTAGAPRGLQSLRPVLRLFKAEGGRDTQRRAWIRGLVAVVIVASGAILLRALLTPAAPPPPITATPAAPAPELGHYAPNVTLTDLAGHSVQIAHWRGQIVVLNFWYVACQPCTLEMPALEREYLAEQGKGVVVVGVNTADDTGAIDDFLHQLGITYPIVRDPDLRAATAYKITDTPTTFILDRQGVIRYKVVGPIDHTALQQDVNALLALK